MTTTITSNGSKWYGESPDSVEKLLVVLGENTLDPRFEQYGDFVMPSEFTTRFFGNFRDLSHVFNIDTDDPQTIEQLTLAIRANQASERYQTARACRKSVLCPDDRILPCILPYWHADRCDGGVR